MTHTVQDEADGGLILAAEECPPEKFEALHHFSQHDDVLIRKLSAHGPVLLRGGRGSGKSALLIEAHRRMRDAKTTFSIYMSLRYLPLLQSDGTEYIAHFCTLLSKAIQDELQSQYPLTDFPSTSDEISLQMALSHLAQLLGKRIVILFDDAAHIGREKPLEVFFDLFRTLSSNTTSCKASIYPGVTKFGIRFDVFNDSTVIDIIRSDVSSGSKYFYDVVRARYPRLSTRETFSDRLAPEQFANLIGRSVVGNMRGFILACNRFDAKEKVSIPDINACLLNMATDYYWPLMEEVAPKLGVYEPLVQPATEVFETIIDHIGRSTRSTARPTPQDRVTIHRNIVGEYSKIFEILEYLGFLAKREASRSLKSGGRGPVYALNLCSLLEQVASKRLTIDMIEDWIEGKPELAEIHSSGSVFGKISVPALQEEIGLGILDKPVDILAKSSAYPYGLTEDKIDRLNNAGFTTVKKLAEASDNELLKIDYVGRASLKRMRDVVVQAIWM